MENSSQVLLICDCGNEELRPAVEPVTGFVHGAGWNYICEVCNRSMTFREIGSRDN